MTSRALLAGIFKLVVRREPGIQLMIGAWPHVIFHFIRVVWDSFEGSFRS